MLWMFHPIYVCGGGLMLLDVGLHVVIVGEAIWAGYEGVGCLTSSVCILKENLRG